MKKIALLAAAFGLSACSTAFDRYTSPAVAVPPAYVGGMSSDMRQAALLPWWQALGDPLLNSFVARGLQSNLTVLAALERINAAQANLRRFGPAQQVDGGLSADARRVRSSDGTIREDTTISADAVFVFDLFGEFSGRQARSLAELQAANLEVGAVRLAYLGEVVSNYIEARYYQAGAEITQRSIRSRRSALSVVRERLAAEEATQLELAQAQSLLASAEATLPFYLAQFRVNAFAIAALLDLPPAEVLARMNAGRSQPVPTSQYAAGVPADLLRNRPDVRAAERLLAAAVADARIAQAQLYPSLRLAGNISAGEGRTWSFGPSVDLAIFDQPRRRANLDIARSGIVQAELAYRLEVVEAVRDVEVALVQTAAGRAQVDAYRRAVSASDRVANLSRTAFREDAATIDDVLDAERQSLNDRLNLAAALRDLALSWTQLQVATGKGWLVGTSEITYDPTLAKY